MRGMIKWKPFNSLLNKNDIQEIIKKKTLIQKPSIMEDKIIEINNTLIESINNNSKVEITYFNKGLLNKQIGIIEKINKIEKYILINKKRIYFKNLFNINLL